MPRKKGQSLVDQIDQSEEIRDVEDLRSTALRRSARLASNISRPKITDESGEEPPPKKAKKSQKQVKAEDSELTNKLSKPLYKLSSNVFPRLDSPTFGLAQEKLADEPFKVLVACIFLTRTKGTVSMPVCRELFRQYPTPEDIADADIVHITSMLQPLGLHNRRAKTIISLATAWVGRTPEHGRRYRKLHYPVRGDGADIAPSEQPIQDDVYDPRIAWEVAHLPGVGAYALDSWRIFCRDKLRGIRDGVLDVKSEEDIQDERRQEWTRVIPLDKELLAYIRWRWLRLSYLWDPVDGTKIKVNSDIVNRLQSRELRSYKGFRSPWLEYAAKAEEAADDGQVES